MSITRKSILKKINSKEDKIFKLQNEIKLLRIQEYQICDKHQKYYEEDIEVIVSKRPKKTEMINRGVVRWDEYFVDEDTHEVIYIERNKVVMENGVWFV